MNAEFDTGKLHSFLKRFALNVDSERLQRALPRVQEIVKAQKPKKGLSFKILLQELDHEIDWRLASELEEKFLTT